MKLTLPLALASLAAAALPAIEIRGNAFYESGTNNRFYIRGIDYQPGGSSKLADPLADEATCGRDVPKFSDLGVNMIRVYSVDNSKSHDACMKQLEDAGIYVLLDVNTPTQSLQRGTDEQLATSYNSGYLQHIFATIDAFKSYDNTFGFFAANEVINNENNTNAAPYIKAVVRDMKAYIKAQANRTIPVGYSAADVADSRWEQMSYLNCGDDAERIDMFGMNDYSYCGDASSFQISGWATNVKNYASYSIPMFLSEYGCNTNRPRTFPEVHSLFSTDMSSVYSGGLVYEYTEEENEYGLVEVKGNSTTETPDYQNFKKALANAQDPPGDAGASTDKQPSTCPPRKAGFWEIDGDVAPPPMPSYAQRYLKNGAGKGLGLNGPGTQQGSDLDNGNKTSSAHSSSAATSSSAASSSSQAASSSDAATSSDSASSSSASSTKKSKNGAEALPITGLGIVGVILTFFI